MSKQDPSVKLCGTAADLPVVRWLQQFWRVLRELVGDDAYERYCAHHQLRHANEQPLDRQAFYMKNQQEKWNGIKRCC